MRRGVLGAGGRASASGQGFSISELIIASGLFPNSARLARFFVIRYTGYGIMKINRKVTA